MRLGTRLGGSPYGIGTWNSPSLRKRYPAKTVHDMRRMKKEIDPHGVLNPGKFFRLRARFFNIPGPIFHPWDLRGEPRSPNFISPVVGLVARLSKPERDPRWSPPLPEAEKGASLLSQPRSGARFAGLEFVVLPNPNPGPAGHGQGQAEARRRGPSQKRSRTQKPAGPQASGAACARKSARPGCLVDSYTALELSSKGGGRPAETMPGSSARSMRTGID